MKDTYVLSSWRKKWLEDNKERIKAYNKWWPKEKKRRQKEDEVVAVMRDCIWEENKRQWREDYKEKQRQKRENLVDSYIAGLFKIPLFVLKQCPELIEAKRLQMQIKRECKLN